MLVHCYPLALMRCAVTHKLFLLFSFICCRWFTSSRASRERNAGRTKCEKLKMTCAQSERMPKAEYSRERERYSEGRRKSFNFILYLMNARCIRRVFIAIHCTIGVGEFSFRMRAHTYQTNRRWIERERERGRAVDDNAIPKRWKKI